MTAPLAGIRVVELATFVAVPSCGALLADLGAEVIKVEVPQGEVYRHSRPKLMGIRSDFPEAPQYQMDNRGKRSLTLDLTRPAAADALRKLIGTADAFIANMLPHRLERYGLDPQSLRDAKPGLIVATLSGYGPMGPDANRPAFDYTAYWARTGLMDIMRETDGPPTLLRPGVGDHAAALALSTGILSALRVRDQTGEGQTVDVNLMHVGYYILGNDTALALAGGAPTPANDRHRPRNPLWNQYETADGRWLVLVMIESDRYWKPFCEAIERPDLLADERLADARGRFKNSPELTATLAEVFRQQSLEEWTRQFDGKTLIWAPVQSLPEALEDEQARATGVFQEVDHPVAGTYETVAPPIRMSGHTMRGEQPAPALGADNEDVLRSAGLDDAEIRAALGDD